MRKENKYKGTESVEHFHHFRCGRCKKWWGIGDKPPSLKEQFCPWCGVRQGFENKTPKDLEKNM